MTHGVADWALLMTQCFWDVRPVGFYHVMRRRLLSLVGQTRQVEFLGLPLS